MTTPTIPVLFADDGTMLPLTVESLYKVAVETHEFAAKSQLGAFTSGLVTAVLLHELVSRMTVEQAVQTFLALRTSIEETVVNLMQEGATNANESDTIRPAPGAGSDPRYH